MAELLNREDLASQLRISLYDLEKEWTLIPSLLSSYVFMYADARYQLELAKQELDRYRADLGLRIRQNPKSFGIDKVTEAAIEECINTDDTYNKLGTRYLEWKYKVQLLSGVIQALEAKKKALENLVQLFAIGYFSEPRRKPKYAENLESLATSMTNEITQYLESIAEDSP